MFTAVVTGSGTAAPSGTVVFTIDGQAEAPVTLSWWMAWLKRH